MDFFLKYGYLFFKIIYLSINNSHYEFALVDYLEFIKLGSVCGCEIDALMHERRSFLQHGIVNGLISFINEKMSLLLMKGSEELFKSFLVSDGPKDKRDFKIILEVFVIFCHFIYQN